MRIHKIAMACVLSGALVAATVTSAGAAPLPTNVATMKSMVADAPVEVHWRGGWGWGIGAGVLAGAIIGGAIASGPYGYYGSPYYYGYSYPSYGYYYPSYYSYGPSYGYGYRTYRYYRPYAYYRPYRAYYHHRWHRHW